MVDGHHFFGGTFPPHGKSIQSDTRSPGTYDDCDARQPLEPRLSASSGLLASASTAGCVFTVVSSTPLLSNRHRPSSSDIDRCASPALVSSSTESASCSTTRPRESLERACTTPCSPIFKNGSSCGPPQSQRRPDGDGDGAEKRERQRIADHRPVGRRIRQHHGIRGSGARRLTTSFATIHANRHAAIQATTDRTSPSASRPRTMRRREAPSD